MTSTRATRLDTTFARFIAAAETAGLDTTNVAVSTGSKTYGIAFRVFRVVAHGGHANFYGLDFLGMTSTEAIHALNTMTDAFYAVDYAKRGI